MQRKNGLALRLIIIFYFMLACLGILDSAAPNQFLIYILTPFMAAAASFYSGLNRVSFGGRENLILLSFNIAFLFLTYKNGFYMLNIFLIAILLWSLITPAVAIFKGGIGASVAAAVCMAFIIPYYKLQIPLSILIFYPFYLFGYMSVNLRIKADRKTSLYCLLGALLSSGNLYIAFAKSVYIKDIYGLLFDPGINGSITLHAFSPVLAVSFLLLCFSVLILFRDAVNLSGVEGMNKVNWRAAAISVCIILVIIYLVDISSASLYLRYCLLISTAVLLKILYGIFDKFFEYFPYIKSREPVKREVDLGNIYSKILSTVLFVSLIVMSIEYVIGGSNIQVIIDHISSASFAYNVLFVSILYLFIRSLVGVRLGTLVMLLWHMFLVVSNYIKLKYFNEPFYIWDMYIIRNALLIYKDYVNLSMVVAVSSIFMIFIILIIKNIGRTAKALKPAPNAKLALLLLIPLIFNLRMLDSDGLQGLNITKGWNDGTEDFLRNGTYVQNYLYFRNIKSYLIKKPKDYSQGKINQIRKEIPREESTSDLKPNVVIVLGETFWDPENLQHIKISRDISKNLKKYKNGTLIASEFGWGTANIEFEVLTGLSNFYFNKGIVPYNVYFNRSIPSVVSVFRDNGYSTTAIHPNTGAMYNRTNAYKSLGFNKFIDISGFDYAKDAKGNYVSDEKVVDRILNTLNDVSGPKFIFAAMIQNHDPYDDRSKNYSQRDVDVQSDRLDNVETEILNNFTQGMYDADKALGRLITEIDRIKQPTLVYYFGDHLPRLGWPKGIFDIYEKLGFANNDKKPEADEKFYETPLIMWSNYRKMDKLNMPMSPNQLAMEVLKDSEVKYPVYFNYLMELREKYPCLNYYLLDKNKIINEEVINNYYLIQYDIMFGNHYILK